MAAVTEIMSMPSAGTAFELLSVVWTEAALFGFAAVAYLAFSGVRGFSEKHHSKKGPLKVPGSPKTRVGRDALPKNGKKPNFPDASKGNLTKGGGQAVVAAAADSGNQIHGKDPAAKARSIRMLGRSGDLEGAVALFEQALPSFESSAGPYTCSGGKPATLLINGVIDACAECGDLGRASSYLARAQALNLADAVSFNTLMKGYLAAGDEETAQKLLAELSKMSGQATQVSYHGIMNARISAGDTCGAWRCFDEMQASGVSPNSVTCAILLKGVVAPADSFCLRRVLKLIEGLRQPMDEVLLSSVVDACLRSGQLKELAKIMEQDGRPTGALSAPTYGALIKAYGQARDVKRVWATWREMLEQEVQPSQVTLGCLVEALVTNRHAEEAWQLVQEMWSGEATSSLVNTVSVSTLLKGFARQPDRVVAIYEEMRSRQIESNVITYNTILNAFAESGSMDRAPSLLDDMKAATPAVEPDIVTYSTLIKGFCSTGALDRALDLLEEMKRDGKYKPDEVMYNSLLDGCAKEQRVKEALKLIDDMQAMDVRPSNYTLSMLVKLLGRCRMLSQAFAMVEGLTKQYSFRLNIQVYTCLIQACFQNRQHAKAVSLLDRIIADGLSPDEKMYTALVRGCLQARQTDLAVKMVRRAYQDASPPAGVDAKILEDVIRKLGTGSEAAESLMADVRRPVCAAKAGACRKQQQCHAKSGGKPPWRRSAADGMPECGSGSGSEAATSSDGTSTTTSASGRGGKKQAGNWHSRSDSSCSD